MDALQQASRATTNTVNGLLNRISGAFGHLRQDKRSTSLLALTAALGVSYFGWKAYQRSFAPNLSENAIVVITGGSQGIGLATAHLLAAQGSHVVLLARSKAKLKEAVKAVSAHGRVSAFACDCSNARMVKDVFARIYQEVGDVDVLLNCAGAGRFRALWEQSADAVIGAMEVPLLAAMLCSREVLPHMLHRRKGWIMNVQSPASLAAIPGATAYVAMRWGLAGLTAALAADTAGTGVLVQDVVLGTVDSSYFSNNPGSWERQPGIYSSLVAPISTAQAARGVLYALQSGAPTYTYPLSLRCLRVVNALLPGPVQALMTASGWRPSLERGVVLPEDAAPAAAAATAGAEAAVDDTNA